MSNGVRDPLDLIVEKLRAAGSKFSGGEDWTCPAHDDKTASLGIARGRQRPLIMKCQAGCTFQEVLDALGMTKDEAAGQRVTVYPYVDAAGTLLYEIWRWDYHDGSKKIRPFTYDSNGKKHAGLGPHKRVLYRLPDVMAGVDAARTVWIVEGEKSADALAALGQVATTIGAATVPWEPRFTELLMHSKVRVVADNDPAGFGRALSIADPLSKAGADVKVYKSLTVAPGDDVVDHIAAGFGLPELVRVSRRELVSIAKEIAATAPESDVDADGGVGERSRDFDETWPSPSKPYNVAREFVRRYYAIRNPHDPRDVQPFSTLYHWRGSWYTWSAEFGWQDTPTNEISSHLTRVLSTATYLGKEGKLSWPLVTSRVNDIMAMLEKLCVLPSWIDEGHWLDRSENEYEAQEWVAFRNGVLNIRTKAFEPASPVWWALGSVPFNYDPALDWRTAAAPWLAFVESLWPGEDGAAQRSLLAEWFGYIVSRQTKCQKMMFVYGPKRSGKGTIGEVLRQITGPRNVTAPTLDQLGQQFGVQQLVGRSLALVGDARFDGSSRSVSMSSVVERLLSISGEDTQTVDRKFKEPYIGKLGVRFCFLTNELLALRENSGALASRFLILRTVRSWAGSEDFDLGRRLHDPVVLAGVVGWALDGLRRLEGHHWQFTHVRDSDESMSELQELSSPLLAFTRECCQFGSFTTTHTEFYTAYVDWCTRNGHRTPSSNVLSRNIRAQFPELEMSRSLDRASDGSTPRKRTWHGLKILPFIVSAG